MTWMYNIELKIWGPHCWNDITTLCTEFLCITMKCPVLKSPCSLRKYYMTFVRYHKCWQDYTGNGKGFTIICVGIHYFQSRKRSHHTNGNLIKSSNAYMHQCIMPPLVHITACRLFGTKPLSNYDWRIVKCEKNTYHTMYSKNVVCFVLAILSRTQHIKSQNE